MPAHSANFKRDAGRRMRGHSASARGIGLEYDPASQDALTVHARLKKDFEAANSNVLAAELTLAKNKKLLEVLQDRIVSIREEVQEAAEDDPILKELAVLLDLAEKDYKRTAAIEGVDEKQLDEKKKTMTETRLALLRRKEKLSEASLQQDAAKARDEMMQWEKEIAGISVELGAARKSLAEEKERLDKWNMLWAEKEDAFRRQSELRKEHFNLVELKQRYDVPHAARVVQEPALVVGTKE